MRSRYVRPPASPFTRLDIASLPLPRPRSGWPLLLSRAHKLEEAQRRTALRSRLLTAGCCDAGALDACYDVARRIAGRGERGGGRRSAHQSRGRHRGACGVRCNARWGTMTRACVRARFVFFSWSFLVRYHVILCDLMRSWKAWHSRSVSLAGVCSCVAPHARAFARA